VQSWTKRGFTSWRGEEVFYNLVLSSCAACPEKKGKRAVLGRKEVRGGELFFSKGKGRV